jgi:hypothetical protein
MIGTIFKSRTLYTGATVSESAGAPVLPRRVLSESAAM